MAEGQRVDAQRQIKKDAITQDRLIRHKKIPRPARVGLPDEPREPED